LIIKNYLNIIIKTRGYFHRQGIEGKGNTENVPGELGKEGNSAIRILKGQRKRKKKEKHKGLPKEGGIDSVAQPIAGGEIKCPLKKTRVIKQGLGKFVLSFEVDNPASKGIIDLVAVGENGKSNKIKIKDAQLVSGCSSVYMSGGELRFSEMRKNEKIMVNITLAGNHDYAMEVNVYEHN